jgi:uncharacterized protein (TIGR02001 family)
MNIRTSLLCSTLALLAASVRADTTPAAATPPAAPAADAPSGVSIVVTPAVVNQYMFRGVRLGGPSFQPAVEVDSGSLAIGVWTNTPISDKVPGQSNPEVDPYGSYTLKVNDSFSVVPGFTWYNYPNAKTGNGFYKSTFEPNIAVNYTVSGVQFTPKLYYDVVLNGPTYELTATYAVPLKDAGTELDFTATGGTYIIKDSVKGANPEVKNWGNYYLVGVAAPFAITKQSKLTVGFAYTEGSGNYFKQGKTPRSQNSAAVGRGVATISYAYTF